MGISSKPQTNSEKTLIASMPHIEIRALAFGDLEILTDLDRDMHIRTIK